MLNLPDTEHGLGLREGLFPMPVVVFVVVVVVVVVVVSLLLSQHQIARTACVSGVLGAQRHLQSRKHTRPRILHQHAKQAS